MIPDLGSLLLFLRNIPWLTAGGGDILFLLAYLYYTKLGIIGQLSISIKLCLVFLVFDLGLDIGFDHIPSKIFFC